MNAFVPFPPSVTPAVFDKPPAGSDSPSASSSVLRNLTIGHAVVVGVLAALAIMAYAGLKSVATSEWVMFEQNFGNVHDLANFRSNLNAERLDIFVMIETPAATWEPWFKDLDERVTANREILKRLERQLQRKPQALAKLRELIAIREKFIETRTNEVVPRLHAGRMAEAKEVLLGIQMSRHLQMRALARALEADETAEAESMAGGAHRTAQNSLFVIATAGGAAILGAIVLSVFLHRSVGRYIGERGRAEDALRRTNRALRTRSLCSQALVRSASEAALLNRLCEAIVSEGGYRFAWIGFADDDPEKNVRPVAQAGSDAGYLERARISWADSALGRGPTGNAIRTGRPSVCRDVRNDPDFAPWRDEALKRGFASSVVLPLLAEGRVFGALNIYATEAGVFDEAEVQLLSELADDLAFGIQAHRLRNERQRAQAALKEAAGYNRRLLEASLDPLVTIGADGRITDANVATETMTGRSRTELIGTDFSDYFTEPDKARAGYQQAFRDGLVRDYVLKMRHRDGRITTVLYNASVYRNEQGDITGVFAAARDVTERLRAEQEILHLNTDLEQRVRARTAELETANRELEAFSYSVSHDLRAPLRSIDGFSRIALNQPDDLLSAKTREALGYVREGAQQMGQLIDDLLVFSRLGRQPLRRGRVLPDQLVRSCLETLRPEREGRRVEIAIGDLPACEADAGLLKQVWMNLLANALKYSRKRDPARIEIGCQQNGENVYFVRDNGVGFKMAYAHKLFGVFQRLHRMEDYEGTGVGLATAHRIVSRHGGRIWAEAEIDRGATFFFTLGAAGSSLATSRDAPATPEMVSTSCSSQRVTPPTETTNALAVHERTS